MKKERLKGWLSLGGALLILLYIGSVYRLSGFSAGYGLVLLAAMISVPVLLLAAYRRVGSLPAWVTLAAALPVLGYATGNVATAVLSWTFCCGTPLAVTLFWAYFKKLRPLTGYALPVAAAVWVGGTLVYSKLHFGSWDLSVITQRIAARYATMVDQMETLYQQLYNQQLPEQLGEMFDLLRSQATTMGFYLVTMIAFALFGLFFLAIFGADRSFPQGARWLGSWSVLIPGRGISWLFMGCYILVELVGGTYFQILLAVLNLFGFFFVFTALYRLRRLLYRKSWHPALQAMLIGLLFALSYFSVGGSLLSVNTILMYVGWWIATLPKTFKNPS